MRFVALLLLTVILAVAAGCGDAAPTAFRVSAERACKRVGDDGLRALALVGSIAPAGDDERRAQRVLVRFARGGDPKVSDLIAVRDAGLPGCADVLAGR